MIRVKQGRLEVPLDTEGQRVIDFASKDDYFLFLALTGNYTTLADEYQRLMGGKLDTKQYRYYRARNQDAVRVMSETKLTDGTPLLDAIKGKINL